MANWKGTPVPSSGQVDKIYFNTNLSIDEVIAICSNLQYTISDVLPIYSVIVAANQELTKALVIYYIAKNNGVHCEIFLVTPDGEITIFRYNNIPGEEGVGREGWNEINSFDFNDVNVLSVAGPQLGYIDQNELLSELISSTPFKDVSLNGFLTDIADAIRTKKETTEPINAQDFANEILNIKTGDTEIEDSIIDGTITKINNKNVTKIKESLFLNNNRLTEANFQNCLIIGSNAFDNCYKLTTISFPNCEYIYSNAFQRCSKLSIVDLPNCSGMDSNTFPRLSNLAEVNLPNCLTIGSSAFYYCSNLTNINLNNLMAAETAAFQGCSNLAEVNLQKLSFCAQSLFYSCNKISMIDLPCCISLNAYCFQNCSKLEKINIYNKSVSFTSNAFANTPIADSSYLGYFGSIYVPNFAVDYFKSATNWAYYSDRITALPSEYDSKYVYGLEFNGSSLTQIPEEKRNAEIICASAFINCTKLTEANFPNCKIVAPSAFGGCFSLTTISFPNCETIHTTAFQRCSKLSIVDLPNCSFIGSSAFYYCSNISLVSLPKLRLAGKNVFAYCSRIKEIDLPECRNMVTAAFSACERLTKINLPICREIGYSAFAGCKALVEINAPKCLTINESAFDRCSSLKEVSFPNCDYIKYNAFSNCSKLESLYLNVKRPPLLQYSLTSSPFANTPIADSSYLGYFGSIYVPTSLYNDFIVATNWSIYSDRIVATDFDD